ncbi:MAG: hypothetical protein NXI31_01260 [bacterium]|nr:hypothetical protein [bacterium]
MAPSFAVANAAGPRSDRHMERAEQPGRGYVGTTSIVFLAALGLGVLLRRYTAHGSDVFFFMRWLEDDSVLAQHPLALVVARGFRELVLVVTDDRMTALAWLSATGVALGVAALHRSALQVRSARQARWFAMVVLATPALAFFATIGELPGPFFGAAGLAILAGVRWWVGGGLGRAAVTGVATAAAALMHGSGHVLVLPVASAWLVLVPAGTARSVSVRVRQAMAFVAVHALGYWLGRAAILAAAGAAVGEAPVAGVVDRWLSASWWLEALPHAIGTQWYLAFAPWSWLALLAFFGAGTRRAALLLHLVVLAYVGLAATIAPGVDEVGSYCLPLAFGVALVVLDRLPSRLWPVAVVLGVVTVALDRGLRPAIAPDFGFGATVYASKGGPDRVWLVGHERESMGARWHNREPQLIEAWITLVDLEMRSGGKAANVPEPLLLAWLEATRTQALSEHEELVVGERAVAALGERLPAFAAAWRRFLAAHSPQSLGGEDGWRGHVFARN